MALSREGSEKPHNKLFPILTLNLNLIGCFGTLGSTGKYFSFINFNDMLVSENPRFFRCRFCNAI